MSLGSRIRSSAVGALLGDRSRSVQRLAAELRRRLTGSAHEISVFLQLDDPHSYLLSLYLPQIVDAYDVALRIYLTQSLGDDFSPEPALMAEYALKDCESVARELGVPFLDKGGTPVVEHRRALMGLLAGAVATADFPTLVAAALSGYWRGDTEGVARMLSGYRLTEDDAAAVERIVATGQEKLAKLGHYDTATLHYGGEWYRGIDRLAHLTARLDKLGLGTSETTGAGVPALRQAMQLALPAAVPACAGDLPPLEFFFSFRSPYSYLSMRRVFDIADAYGLTLRLRPVLPMVMRGLPVPGKKIRYIVADAKREADRWNIDFGRMCDPLGAGVERCMAVLDYARRERRAREFMLAAGRAVWADATDVASDSGMRKVTEAAGLFWPDVVAAMQSDDWRMAAERNQEALTEAGLWGVPSFLFGDVAMWGQDRVWLLARHIEDRCHDGEGILI